MQKWKVLDTSYLLESPFGNIRKDKCLLPDGKIIENYIVHEYAEWANIVVITKEKEMVFVRQYRHGCGDFSLEIPGGSVPKDETAMEAVVRELREETGYVSDESPIKIGSFLTNPALATNRITTFLVSNAQKRYKQSLDDTEEIDVELIPFDRVSALIQSGEISQIFTVAAYFAAKEFVNAQSFQH